MAKILFLSQDGAGLPIAYAARLAGHDVSTWIEKDKSKHLYDGLLPKVKRWEEGLGKGVTCVFDTVTIGVKKEQIPTKDAQWASYTSLSDRLRKEGYPVVGSAGVSDRMELDRTWGAELAKRAGLTLPKTHKCNSIEDAIHYVKAHPGRYVSKPHGNLETFKVYLGRNDDGEDMVDMLTQYKERSKEPMTVELQELIDGQQMSIEVWKSGKKFSGYNSTFEFKFMLPDDSGPMTGETGSVVFHYPDGITSKMYDEVLKKLEPLLLEIDFPNGPIDCNCIIRTTDGLPYFLEFSPRFGYPALYILAHSITDDWGDVLEAMGAGTFTGFHPKPYKWYLGNRVWISDWPYGKTEPTYVGWPAFSQLRKDHLPHVALVDAHWDRGRLRAAGTDGELMCISDGGDSLAEVEAKVHRLIREIKLSGMGWRNDVGEKINLDDLARWKYWLPAPA